MNNILKNNVGHTQHNNVSTYDAKNEVTCNILTFDCIHLNVSSKRSKPYQNSNNGQFLYNDTVLRKMHKNVKSIFLFGQNINQQNNGTKYLSVVQQLIKQKHMVSIIVNEKIEENNVTNKILDLVDGVIFNVNNNFKFTSKEIESILTSFYRHHVKISFRCNIVDENDLTRIFKIINSIDFSKVKLAVNIDLRVEKNLFEIASNKFPIEENLINKININVHLDTDDDIVINHDGTIELNEYVINDLFDKDFDITKYPKTLQEIINKNVSKIYIDKSGRDFIDKMEIGNLLFFDVEAFPPYTKYKQIKKEKMYDYPFLWTALLVKNGTVTERYSSAIDWKLEDVNNENNLKIYTDFYKILQSNKIDRIIVSDGDLEKIFIEYMFMVVFNKNNNFTQYFRNSKLVLSKITNIQHLFKCFIVDGVKNKNTSSSKTLNFVLSNDNTFQFQRRSSKSDGTSAEVPVKAYEAYINKEKLNEIRDITEYCFDDVYSDYALFRYAQICSDKNFNQFKKHNVLPTEVENK